MRKKWVLFLCAVLSLGHPFAQHFISGKSGNGNLPIATTAANFLVVPQKIVSCMDGLIPTYLGPPEIN